MIPKKDRLGFPFWKGSDASHRKVRVSLQGGVKPDTDRPEFPFREG